MGRHDPEPDIHLVNMAKPGIRKVLGDLEAEVMEIMWAWPIAAGATVREVHAELEARRPIAYTTVMNTMTRLAKKKLLTADTQELAYVYRPALAKKAFVMHFLDRIIGDLLQNFAGDAEISIRRQRRHGRQREQAVKRSEQLLEDIAMRQSQQRKR